MSDDRLWPETESKIHQPAIWLVALVGGVFLTIGCVGSVFAGVGKLPGLPIWIIRSFFGVFALAGGALLLWLVRNVCYPNRIRHAASDVFPDIPSEPVLQEGSTVHGRLTHELIAVDQDWQFRPAERIRRNDTRFLYIFGVSFLIVFASGLTYVFQGKLENWPLSAVCGVLVTVLCGGTCFVLIGMLLQSSYRRLAMLIIPSDGRDVKLEVAVRPDLEKADLSDGLKWIFLGEHDRKILTVPRSRIVAVQLCPWKYTFGRRGDTSTTWAAQGLLVLNGSEDERYLRIQILLTGDFVGAARIMRDLADILSLPYLFSADATGWKAEALRARHRPPLASGGLIS